MIFSKQEEKIHIRIGIGYVFVTFNSTTNAENKTDFNRSKIVFEFVRFFPIAGFRNEIVLSLFLEYELNIWTIL